MNKTKKLLIDDDEFGICKRGVQILAEHGLAHEVRDRESHLSVQSVFEEHELPFKIVRTGIDWFELYKTEGV